MRVLVSMNIKILVCVFLFLRTTISFALPCEGQGTVFFFGNGMFNTYSEAQKSLRVLQDETKAAGILDSEKKNLFENAYKQSEPVLEQIFNVFIQKYTDDTISFWLWVLNLTPTPKEFKKRAEEIFFEAYLRGLKNFNDLGDHLERYAHYILRGYNIILVSHSQGNLYANKAMRKLKNYTDSSLTGSIEDKRLKNPLFPEFFEIFANIQVASPVSETVNSSPYFIFKDDAVINFVRKATRSVLPANLSDAGSIKDKWGHNFVDAYFHVSESREKVLNEIRVAYQRLKYPIAYFQDAVAIGYDRTQFSDDPYLYFDFIRNDGSRHMSADEKYPDQNTIRHINFARCFDLKLGLIKLKGSVHVEKKDTPSSSAPNYLIWADGSYQSKPPEVKSLSSRESGPLEYGEIEIQKGSGKEPLQLKVTIYEKPIKKK